MKKSIYGLLISVTLFFITACSSTYDPTGRAPAFLPDYSLLKPVESAPPGAQMYTYIDPKAKRSDYHAGIVESVILYQTATESGITQAQIEKARAGIDVGIKKIVSRQIAITDKPGPGVFRLQVAITGATLEKDGLKPWNLIPISAAIKLASMATGLDSKKPVLIIELKFTNSQSGKLLKEVVTAISGEEFRLESNTNEEFQKLAAQWVDTALTYSR